ncbi:hypothetical protein BAU15_05750 [Enterococcus sp. JM4C]|uniref:VanZ family protein n=1 Tax=Candidatus Enterococcus huntleyi TaxID=1857217 RepID=UPI00137B49F4|nr:VanZ family protein [Enterococcus sp. JM4C]KAF1295253.1 hypothetical protein BAU15_05750 [Enterococcus sp. JM4C]
MKAIKKQMKNGNLYLGIAFFVMAVLFYSSSQTYEQQSQIAFLGKLLKNEPFKDFFETISFVYAGDEVSIKASGYLKFIEFFIRKGAHFGTYFLMGGSLFLGLYPRLKVIWLPSILGWLAATGYAGLDEFHQMMTDGRSPLFQDVALDSCGALTAVVLASVLFIWHKKSR